MGVISNLSDLCQFFGVDDPRTLNRQLYKWTTCGASISLHVGSIGQKQTTYSLVFKQDKDRIVLDSVRVMGRFCRANLIHVDVRHLFALTFRDGIAESRVFNDLSDFATACRKFMENVKTYKKEMSFVQIASVDDSSSGKVAVKVFHGYSNDQSTWLHNGMSWRVTKRTNLIGFTIQSVVDGSEVTVCSEEFVLPVDTEKIDEWMQEMDEQTRFYWYRDNMFHWKLTGPDRKEYFFDSGWGEPKWHFNLEEVPENVRNRVVSWIDKRYENCQGDAHYDKPFRFGCKGWTVEEYQNNSTY